MLQTATIHPQQNTIFFILLGLILLFSLRKKSPTETGLSNLVTLNLKGLAMLTIVLGHIGYFLFTDHNFLYPLSTISGIGVDIFLFLSGFGLTISSLQKNLPWKEFYLRRLHKIFLPLWGTLLIFLLMDWFILGKSTTTSTILTSFLGFYPSADIYQDLNSPLWYITPILFYYLIFPWVFQPRRPWLSTLLITTSSWLVLTQIPLPITSTVQHLYSLHYLAFPLGIAIALLSHHLPKTPFLKTLQRRAAKLPHIKTFLPSLLIIIGLLGFLTSQRGATTTLDYQILSLIGTSGLILIFTANKLTNLALSIFGRYSYEIYLLHWPLLYRYDLLYQYLPPALATILWLLLLLSFGWLLHALGDMITIRRRTQTK